MHDFGRGEVVEKLLLHEVHRGSNMLEEHLPTFAEVGVAWFSCGIGGKARAGTIAIAGESPFAGLALASEEAFFVCAKLELRITIQHRSERLLHQIAEFELGKNVVVAGIDIAVVLNGRGVATGGSHRAKTALHSHPSGERGIEHLYENVAHVFRYPFVKNATEKFSPRFGRDAEGGDFGGGQCFNRVGQEAAIGMAIMAFDDGGEL